MVCSHVRLSTHMSIQNFSICKSGASFRISCEFTGRFSITKGTRTGSPMSYEDANFGASSFLTFSNIPHGPEAAFKHAPAPGWCMGRWARVPQLLTITFPSKRRVGRISFMLRRDNLLIGNRFSAPTEFKIVASNEPIPITTNGLIDQSFIGAKGNWHTLMHAQNVMWKDFDSVYVAQIDEGKREFYSTYGILVLKSDRKDSDHVVLSRILMWESIWEQCHP